MQWRACEHEVFKKKINQKTIGVIICTDHENLSEDHELSPGFTPMPGISEFALINDITVDIEILSPKLEVDNIKKQRYL